MINNDKIKINEVYQRVDDVAIKGTMYTADFYKLINEFIDNGYIYYFKIVLETIYNITINDISTIPFYKEKIWKEILFQTNTTQATHIKRILDNKNCYQVGMTIYDNSNNILGTIKEKHKYIRLVISTTSVTISATATNREEIEREEDISPELHLQKINNSNNLIPDYTNITDVSDFKKYDEDDATISSEKVSTTSSTTSLQLDNTQVGNNQNIASPSSPTYSYIIATYSHYEDVEDFYAMNYYYLNHIINEMTGLDVICLYVDKLYVTYSEVGVSFSYSPTNSFCSIDIPYENGVTYSNYVTYSDIYTFSSTINNKITSNCFNNYSYTQSIYHNIHPSYTTHSYTYDIDTTYSNYDVFDNSTISFYTYVTQSVIYNTTINRIFDCVTTSIFTKYKEAIDYLLN